MIALPILIWMYRQWGNVVSDISTLTTADYNNHYRIQLLPENDFQLVLFSLKKNVSKPAFVCFDSMLLQNIKCFSILGSFVKPF